MQLFQLQSYGWLLIWIEFKTISFLFCGSAENCRCIPHTTFCYISLFSDIKCTARIIQMSLPNFEGFFNHKIKRNSRTTISWKKKIKKIKPHCFFSYRDIAAETILHKGIPPRVIFTIKKMSENLSVLYIYVFVSCLNSLSIFLHFQLDHGGNVVRTELAKLFGKIPCKLHKEASMIIHHKEFKLTTRV